MMPRDDDDSDLVPTCAVEKNPDGTTEVYDICNLDSCPISGRKKKPSEMDVALWIVIWISGWYSM